jgi:transcriptional regulator with XRE-family HTH domain
MVLQHVTIPKEKYLFNGEGFRFYRESVLKISLRECAKRLGVGPSYLSRIEIAKEPVRISNALAERVGKL